MTTSSAPRIRNTVMRTRKMRGEESLKGSRSRAMAAFRRCPPYRTAARKGMPGHRDAPVARGSSGGGVFQQRQQLPMHALVSGNDMALFEHGVAAFEVGGESAGLAHQQHPCGQIPRREVALPIAVEPARRHPGEIERRRSESPQPADAALYRRDLFTELRKIAAPAVRQPAADDRVVEPLAAGDAQPAIVHRSE